MSIFEVPEEYSIVAHERIMISNIKVLLKWKRAYYQPDHPEVDDADKVGDSRYDAYEDGIRKNYPDHPFLQLVGWNDSYNDVINWRSPQYLELDTDKLSKSYPDFNWTLKSRFLEE